MTLLSEMTALSQSFINEAQISPPVPSASALLVLHLPQAFPTLPIAELEPLDAGVALLRGARVAVGNETLGDLRVDVAVVGAALQVPLHPLVPPQLQQNERLAV